MPRVAILCAGPSLPSAFGPAEAAAYDAVIAVNSAIHHQPDGFRPDWWVCMDHDAWHGCPLLPRIRDEQRPRVGFAGRIGVLDREPLSAGLRCVEIGNELDSLPHELRRYSVCGAIYFAATRYPVSRIDLYGVDHTPGADFLGLDEGGMRTAERWQREAAALLITCDYARDAGSVVQRVASASVAP